MKLMKNLKDEAIGVARMTKKLAEDDPRRIIHSLKVGLALTLVSLFYYFQTLYASFGVSALWAVMTVVVVFEFSVGATLGKGLNRALATILAGALGVGAHHLAVLSGKTGEPIILSIFVFLQAAITTFVRFFPKIKARYDYGMLIFILTFCLVSISGFRTKEIIELAHKRLSTIMIGAASCVIVAIVVCPVWAGEDLQNLVVLNIEKLATFLEGFGNEYFKRAEEAQVKDNKASNMVGYKSVLNSKSTEETLANFARWEPGHGKFMYCHPWNQYLKVGALTRQCAYRIEALYDFLNSDIQMPEEIRIQIQDIFTETTLNCGIVLREVALAIKTMTTLQPAENSSIAIAKIAAENLKSLLKSDIWKNIEFMQVMPVATLASVLIDVVNCVEKITESVHELSSLARFKSVKLQRKSDETKSSIVAVVPVEIDCPEVVINVKE